MKENNNTLIDNRNYSITLDINEIELYKKALFLLKEQKDLKNFVGNTIEIINPTLILDPLKPYLTFGDVRKAPRKYIEKELKWYLSQSLSIKDFMDDIKIWNDVASKDEYRVINSNYGYLIFSEENYSQYNNAITALKKDINTRQAGMIYTRPSIWKDWNENGKHDFICTNSVFLYIRDNKLLYRIDQRSADLITGFWNDFSWHCYVYQRAYNELKETYGNLLYSNILYNFGSLHVYERSYELFDKIIDFVKNSKEI